MENPKEKEFLQSYETYVDALFRHCYFRVSDREKATDIVQEAFCRTWLYLSSGKDIQNLRAFLYRTANNLIIDEYRKHKSVSLDTLMEAGFEPADESRKNVEEAVLGGEIRSLLKELDESHRAVIIMRYLDGLSPKEIAELLEVSENVISVRIHRGIEKLRQLVGKLSERGAVN